MDVQDAVDNFGNAMQHCDNLVVVHRAGRDGTRGRLTVEPSVNRGTIVLAVAAWQAFIQDIAQALCDKALAELKPVTTTPLTVGAVEQWQVDFVAALRKFSTPAPDQLCTLLQRVGFNPRPSWTWTQRGGRGNGTVLVEPKHVAQVLEQWLKVRHAVAHGHSTLGSLPVLGAVRDPKSSAKAKAAPTLRLADAIDCTKFFRSVGWLTARAAAAHVQADSPTWTSTPPLALGLHISRL